MTIKNMLACGVMVTQRTLTPSFQVRVLTCLPNLGNWYNWEHSSLASYSQRFDSAILHQVQDTYSKTITNDRLLVRLQYLASCQISSLVEHSSRMYPVLLDHQVRYSNQNNLSIKKRGRVRIPGASWSSHWCSGQHEKSEPVLLCSVSSRGRTPVLQSGEGSSSLSWSTKHIPGQFSGRTSARLAECRRFDSYTRYQITFRRTRAWCMGLTVNQCLAGIVTQMRSQVIPGLDPVQPICLLHVDVIQL